MHAERNLLCGILALQLDFISRDQLIHAMNAWILEKQTPLDDILVRQHAIDTDTRVLVMALVEKHLDHHGGDPQRSLAAVSSLGSVRAALQSLGDADVEATLNLMPPASAATDVTAISSDEHPGQRPSSQPGSSVRFRIVRPHAKGGLGEVFVARDEELNREVALKEIQETFASSEQSRVRFRQEAEITGNLEHPGIVPVYGLGQYADGRPYYAMRFIRGGSLKETAQAFHSRFPCSTEAGMSSGEANLELRQLLGRLVDVCNAMEYAHSRGVLHRDLKPGNIVLGKYGETLVVDWGLAKAVGNESDTEESIGPIQLSSGSGSAPTMAGAVIGTPAYMSPEQAQGHIDELGPATDVYSLGATLYHVLTGQSPISADSLEATIQQVRAGSFPAPRSVREDIPVALEAICLKAMALKTTSRYSSPRALAEDIERWLADEPVQAFADPLRARIARWIRKHQTLTTTAAAVTVLGVIGLGISTTLISGKNTELQRLVSELDTKNKELLTSNQRERDAKQEALQNQQIAERNAGIAGAQSALALESLKSVVTDIQEDLRFMPGASQLRRELLRKALAQLAEVSGQFASQETIDRYTLVGLQGLGSVFLKIGPGVAEEERSPLDSAAAAYRQAHTIAEQLHAQNPRSAEANLDLARSYSLIGDVEYQYGNFQDALSAYQNQRTISRRLAGVVPSEIELSDDAESEADAQHNLAVAEYNVAWMLLENQQTAEARTLFESVLEIRQRLAEEMPDDIATQQRFAEAFVYLSRVATQEGRHAESLEYIETAIGICERMLEVDPDDVRNRMSLAQMNSHLGRTLTNLNRYESARVPCGIAKDIRKSIADLDPMNFAAQQMLADTWRALGDIELKAGTPDMAEEPYRAAAEIDRRMAEADPSDAQAQFDLYISYHKAAATQHMQEKFADATTTYQLGLDVLHRLRDEGRLSKDNEQWIGVVENAIRQCTISPVALGDWEQLQQQPAEELPALLELRAQHFATDNRIEESVQAVRALRELGTATPEQLFSVAGVLDNCRNRTALLDDPPEGRADAYGEEGFVLLREAVEAGFDDVVRLENEPYIEGLRDHPDFPALLESLKNESAK